MIYESIVLNLKFEISIYKLDICLCPILNLPENIKFFLMQAEDLIRLFIFIIYFIQIYEDIVKFNFFTN